MASGRGQLRIARSGPGSRASRPGAFSTVELAVSLGIFLLIATVVTTAIAVSLSTSTTVRTTRSVEQVLTSQLAELAQTPYSKLLADAFTVPDACPDPDADPEGDPDADPVEGVDGLSCVDTPAGDLVIGYRFQKLATADADPADTVCDNAARPAGTDDLYGFVGLCARVVSLNGTQVSATQVDYLEQFVRINDPQTSAGGDTSVLRVHVTDAAGQPTNAHDGRFLYLTRAKTGLDEVAAGQIANGVASLRVTNTDAANSCTAADPCLVALQPGDPGGTTPTVLNAVDNLILYGQSDPGTGALAGRGAAGTGPVGSLVLSPGETVHRTVRLSYAGDAVMSLRAVNGSAVSAAFPSNTACAWVTFRDGLTYTVPVCNEGGGHLALDTYSPFWNMPGTARACTDGNPSTACRPVMAFPPGETLRVTAERPDATCPFIDDVDVRDGSWVSSTDAGYGCASWTWGRFTAEDGGSTIELTRPVHDDRDMRDVAAAAAVYDAATGAAIPAAGWPGDIALLTQPRDLPDCAADSSCAPLNPQNLEPKQCPDSYCLSVSANKYPDYSPDVFYDDATGVLTHDVVFTNPGDGPLRLGSTSPDTMNSWSPQISFDGGTTWQAWPATNGVTVHTTDRRTVTAKLRYTRPDNTAVAKLRFTLTNDHGPRFGEFVSRHASAPVVVADASARIRAGQSATVPVVATRGGSYATGTWLVADAHPHLTVTSAQVSGYGAATLGVTVSSSAPAGTYTVQVRPADGAPHLAGSLTITVPQQPAAISVNVTGARQGETGTATATVTDQTGAVIPRTKVSFSITRNGATTSAVKVAPNTACGVPAWGAGDACTVNISVAPDALAGVYQVVARTGSISSPAAQFTVTGIPARMTLSVLDPGANTGSSNWKLTPGATSQARLTITDGTGNKIPGAEYVIEADGDVHTSPLSGTLGSDSAVTVSATAADAAPTGTRAGAIIVDGVRFPFTQTVTARPYVLTPAALTPLPQGGSRTYTVTVTSDGNPASGLEVIAGSIDDRLTLSDVSAVTDSAGKLTFTATAALNMPSGNAPVTVILDGINHEVTLPIAAVPSTVSVTGNLTQDASAPVSVTLLDAAGDPLSGAVVSVTDAPASVAIRSGTGTNSATTDTTGTATFTATDNGPTRRGVYPVTLTGPDGFTRTVMIPLTPSARTTVVRHGDLDQQPGQDATLTVEVLDAVGAPMVDEPLTVTGLPEDVEVTAVGPGAGTSVDFADLDGVISHTGDAADLTVATGTGETSATLDDAAARFTGAGGHLLEAGTPVERVDGQVYRISARVRVTGGTGTFSVGAIGRDTDGALLNPAGAVTADGQYAAAADSAQLAEGDGWVTVVGYLTGEELDVSDPRTPDSGAHPNITDAGVLHADTATLTPFVHLGQDGAAGVTWHVDHLTLTPVASISHDLRTDAAGAASLTFSADPAAAPVSRLLTLAATDPAASAFLTYQILP